MNETSPLLPRIPPEEARQTFSEHFSKCVDDIRNRRYSSALRSYGEFSDLAEAFSNSKDSELSLIAFQCLQYCLRQQGLICEKYLSPPQLTRALDFFQRLSPKSPSSTFSSSRFFQCDHISSILFRLGKYSDALPWFKRTLLHSSHLSPTNHIYNRLCVSLVMCGRFVDGLQWCRLSILIALKDRHFRNVRIGLINMGIIYWMRGGVKKMSEGEDIEPEPEPVVTHSDRQIAKWCWGRAYHSYSESLADREEVRRIVENVVSELELHSVSGSDSDSPSPLSALTDLDLFQLSVIETPMERIPCRVKFISWFVTKIVPKCNSHTLNSLQGFWLRPCSSRTVRVTIEKFSYTDKYGEAVREDLYVYRPKRRPQLQVEGGTKGGSTIVIFYHGGGYVLGHPNQMDHLFKGLCDSINCVIFALNYRKAPNHRLPAAVFDAKALVKWVVREGARKHGGDLQKVVLSGESAGGQMALILANWIRDKGYRLIPKQFLHVIPLYPAVDGTLILAREIRNAVYVSEAMVEYFALLCLPDFPSMKEKMIRARNRKLKSRRRRSAAAAEASHKSQNQIDDEVISALIDKQPIPNLFDKLTDLPSTLMITCEYCLLQLEGQRYYELGSHYNRHWEHRIMPGEVHGFITPNLAANPDSNPNLRRLMVQSIVDRFSEPMVSLIASEVAATRSNTSVSGGREAEVFIPEKRGIAIELGDAADLLPRHMIEVEAPSQGLSINSPFGGASDEDDLGVVSRGLDDVVIGRAASPSTYEEKMYQCLFPISGFLRQSYLILSRHVMHVYPSVRGQRGETPEFSLPYAEVYSFSCQDVDENEVFFEIVDIDQEKHRIHIVRDDEEDLDRDIHMHCDPFLDLDG